MFGAVSCVANVIAIAVDTVITGVARAGNSTLARLGVADVFGTGVAVIGAFIRARGRVTAGSATAAFRAAAFTIGAARAGASRTTILVILVIFDRFAPLIVFFASTATPCKGESAGQREWEKP